MKAEQLYFHVTNTNKLTGTYGYKGVRALREDEGLSFREVLAKDVRDLRRIAGKQYNTGLRALIRYYRDYFPSLMEK